MRSSENQNEQKQNYRRAEATANHNTSFKADINRFLEENNMQAWFIYWEQTWKLQIVSSFTIRRPVSKI